MRPSLIPASTDQTNQKPVLSTGVPVAEEITQTRASYAPNANFLRLTKPSVRRARSTKVKKDKPTKVAEEKVDKKALIERLLKPGMTIPWPREMKAINQLVEKLPIPQFWNSLTLDFKLNSVLWLTSEKGREHLNSEYRKFKFEPAVPKKYEIEENSLVFELKKEENKTLSVKEFLSKWQKNQN